MGEILDSPIMEQHIHIQTLSKFPDETQTHSLAIKPVVTLKV